jgi:hypothetical protein
VRAEQLFETPNRFKRRNHVFLPLVATALLVPFGRTEPEGELESSATVRQDSARALDAAAPGDGTDRPPLVNGIVASEDPGDRESLETYPYLATSSLSHVVDVPAGDPLVAYAWDGGHRIPASAVGRSFLIPYGELGSGPETVLYAPFNRSANPLEPGFRVDARGASIVAGGRVNALRLEDDQSRVRFAGSDGPLVSGGWTIELWWLPGERDRKSSTTLFKAPGFFTLWVDRNGRLNAGFDAEERARMKAPAGVRWGEWNHVALALDQELGAARIVLNDSARRLQLSPEVLAGSIGELHVGKGPQGLGVTGLVDELRIQRVAADSSEMIERYLLGATPGEHLLEVEFASGTRTIPVWAGIHTSPELRDREDWARGDLSHLDPGEEGLRWAPAHWSRDLPIDRPVARTTQPVIYVGDHQAFMFSGETKDSHLPGMLNTADTWIYHIDTMRWERVEGPGPEGRCHQSAAYSPDHDVVLMAGGWMNPNGGEKVVLGDTWLFHVGERRWERREPAGLEIEKATDNGVLYNSKERLFYVFQWDRILTYDPEADVWEQLPGFKVVGAPAPVSEFRIPGSPISEYDPDRDLALIFGGVDYRRDDEGRYLDRTLVFDFETRTLSVMSPDRAPSPRARGALAYDTQRDRFVMFGGVQNQWSDRQRDLWVYDMDANQWEELEDAATPSRRGGYYKMAYDPELDVFSVLCGRASPKRFLNEAWRLHVDESAEGRATYVFDRAGFPDLDRLALRVGEGARDRVRLELASSPDGIAWSDGAAVDRAARFLKVSVVAEAPGAGGAPATISGLAFRSSAEMADHEGPVVELLSVR